GVDRETFYDPDLFALMPMGFCYPGTGKSGDLPPRKECAAKWHQTLLGAMPKVELTLLIGNYAQKYYLPDSPYNTLTERVSHFRDFIPETFVLSHPSPRNNIWMKKNPRFTRELLPVLQETIQNIIP
ncbi:MAG: uracil-DNA glycosylase family protein, partial [Cyclobacteriaceae bacterium]